MPVAPPVPVDSACADHVDSISKKRGCHVQIGCTAWVFAFGHPLSILKG
jgi:hypothetical protein